MLPSKWTVLGALIACAGLAAPDAIADIKAWHERRRLYSKDINNRLAKLEEEVRHGR